MTAAVELLSSTEDLEVFLGHLSRIQEEPEILYVDLEGHQLCREGTLSLMAIFIESKDKVYLIDITVLGKEAFTSSGPGGTTLAKILESDRITKAFFDVRNDSDALFSLYGLRLQGIEDIQLMEVASRAVGQKELVNGLGKCIGRDANLTWQQRQLSDKIKQEGLRLFAPEHGGSYAVFDQRPLSAEIQAYCAQDVTLLPRLRSSYRAKLSGSWWERVIAESSARVVESQSAAYLPNGRHKALAPSAWRFS